MNSIAVIILVLSVWTAAVKMSVRSVRFIVAVSVLWGVAIIAVSPIAATLPAVSLDGIAAGQRGDLWRCALWLEGVVYVLYCIKYVSRVPVSGLLSFYPGLLCSVSFYFLLGNSFICLIGVNFVVCGIVCGVFAGLFVSLSALMLKRLIHSPESRVSVLFVSTMILLLFAALV